MAERNHHQVQPATPQDQEESALIRSKNLNRKKRMKCLAYILALALLLGAIILALSLTLLKVRTPKFHVISGTINTFNMEIIPSPSFTMTMRVQLGVKNRNFGPYDYENSTIYFLYKGVAVGEAAIPEARAGARSTKNVEVVVSLSSRNVRNALQLELDLGVGVLSIESQSQLRGKVKLFNLIKRKKSANMDCTIDINVSDEVVKSFQSCSGNRVESL